MYYMVPGFTMPYMQWQPQLGQASAIQAGMLQRVGVTMVPTGYGAAPGIALQAFASTGQRMQQQAVGCGDAAAVAQLVQTRSDESRAVREALALAFGMKYYGGWNNSDQFQNAGR